MFLSFGTSSSRKRASVLLSLKDLIMNESMTLHVLCQADLFQRRLIIYRHNYYLAGFAFFGAFLATRPNRNNLPRLTSQLISLLPVA